MIRKSAIIILIFLALSVSLYAEDGNSHHFDWNSLIGKILNSTILFGGLFLWLRKPIIEFLTKQSIDIKNDITDREKLLREKTDDLNKLRERLAKIESEVESLKGEASKNGEEEKKRIEELARKEADRIIANSEVEINARIESSIRSLKERVADMTIENFRNEFKKKLDDNLHKKIINDNIGIIGEIDERD